MPLIFTAEQVRAIRQGKVTATLVSRHEPLEPGSVRPLRRRRPCRCGEAVVVEQVFDVRPHDERVQVLLTILEVRDLELASLTVTDARLCGYRTATELRDAWRAEHPRTDLVRLVTFGLGDLRDRPRFLTSFPAFSDYTQSPSEATPREPEALSEDQLSHYASINGQRFAASKAEFAARLAARPLPERLHMIEGAADRFRLGLRKELRIIEQRLERAEKRPARPGD